MKFQTNRLDGDVLDMVVMMAHGFKFVRGKPESEYAVDRRCDTAVWRQSPGGAWACMRCYSHARPSVDWEEGGPIIERERINIRPDQSTPAFRAYVIVRPFGLSHRHIGDTPLIAAMRCYVASKLGDEVDIPEELLP